METRFSGADGGRKGEETLSGALLPGNTAPRYPSLSLPPPSPPPLPPRPLLFPPPSWAGKVKGSRQRRRNFSVASFRSFSLPTSSPPPPPPPLPPPPSLLVKTNRSRQRTKGSSCLSFPSFGSREKETNESKKRSAVDIPAPPPLPPPPSFLRNLFSNLKKEVMIRRQRVHSVTIPPPPPPPPPLPTSSYPRKRSKFNS